MTYSPGAVQLPDLTSFDALSPGQMDALKVGAAIGPAVGLTTQYAHFSRLPPVTQPLTIASAFWVNGATLGSTYQVGLFSYDNATKLLTRLAVSAATAQAGANALQQVALAYTLVPGVVYYLGVVSNNATGVLQTYQVNTVALGSLARMAGVISLLISQNTFTLATYDATTPLADANVRFPFVGVSARGTV